MVKPPAEATCMDEASSDALIGELRHRYRLTRAGRCTYCGGKLSEPECSHPERHRGADRQALLGVVDLISTEQPLAAPEQ